MTTAPFRVTLPTPFVLYPSDEYTLFTSGGSLAAGAWPAANRAIYVPFSLPSTQRVATVTIDCTTSSGTFDLGLYDETGLVRLASMGSTSLASGKNVWTPASPMLIEAGRRYYLAMSVSNTTATILRTSTNVVAINAAGVTQQATAHPLPSPAVPAIAANSYAPLFALTFVQ